MDDSTSNKSSYKTPTLRKKVQKLSLRKICPSSCPPKQEMSQLPRQCKIGNVPQICDDNCPRSAKIGAKSLSPFYKDENFETPPFVTKSRPKYTNDNASLSCLSSDFIENSFETAANANEIAQSLDKDTQSVTVSTPCEKVLDNYKMFDTCLLTDEKTFKLDHSEISKINVNKSVPCESPDLKYPLDVRLNESNEDKKKDEGCGLNYVEEMRTPKNIRNPISPKSAKIMTSLYGDVWKKTPGLFNKTKRINNNYNKIIHQLDSLSLYVESLTRMNNSKNNNLQLDQKEASLNKSSNFGLKPKMLSFETEDDNGLFEIHKNELNNINKTKIDTRMCSGENSSNDSLFNIKRNKKLIIFSSSASGSSDDELSEVNNSGRSRHFINEGSDIEPELIDANIKSTRKSCMRIENDLECSVVLIEDETDPSSGTGKKNRKLFSKQTDFFNEVQFVSEEPPNCEKIKSRVIEIYDDAFVLKNKDKENFDIFGENIQKISVNESIVKPSKDLKDKTVKKYVKKPNEKKKKEENVLEVKSVEINLENIQVASFMTSLTDAVPSWCRNKEGKYYKEKFKSKKAELGQKLFTMFNESVYSNQLDVKLPIIWSTTLNTTAGRACNKIKKSKTGINVKSSSIELSVKVVDTAERLRDTLAHELCHVAAWIIDGQLRDGHGPYWKKWVSKTLRSFPELGSIPVYHTLSIHYKYTFKCIRCGYGVNRHSKSIDVKRKACGYCGGRFECIHNKKNKDGLIVSTPVKNSTKELNGFALYVKENYGNARGSNTPHKQVMRYLGKQYAKMKAVQSSDDGQGNGD